jgi:hypothetical protein
MARGNGPLHGSFPVNPKSEIGVEGFTVAVTGTYLDAGLQPAPHLTPRKRLTVAAAWTARGKERRIQGHLLRTP